jgi:hypothetical protein
MRDEAVGDLARHVGHAWPESAEQDRRRAFAQEVCANGDASEEGSDPSCDRCWDADNDSFAGFESAGYAATVCAEPSDCTDGDLAISPVAFETCDSGVDEECDGLVDAADVADCGGPPILALGAPAAIALAALLAVAGAKGLRRRGP